MAKKEKATNPITDEFDLDNTVLDEMDEIVVAAPASAKGINVMDFSEFMDGIEEITAESEEFTKALFYGPNGTGKTTVSGTFPGPILVLDVNERGTKPLAGTGANKRFVDTFSMFQMAYWFLKSGKHPYKTVVIDNVTTLQEIAMKYIMGKEEEIDSSKDMDMPTIRDWGGLSQVMKRWLIDFRNLPMNVVFIAQEKRNKDDDIESDDVSVFPQVSASVRSILGAGVDVIGRTYTSEVEDKTTGKLTVKYYMRVLPSNKYMAKIRMPIGAVSPPVILNPKYSSLQIIMKGEYTPPVKKVKEVKKEEDI